MHDQATTPPFEASQAGLAFLGGVEVADIETMIFEFGSGYGGALGYAATASPIEDESKVSERALDDSLDEQIMAALVAP